MEQLEKSLAHAPAADAVSEKSYIAPPDLTKPVHPNCQPCYDAIADHEASEDDSRRLRRGANADKFLRRDKTPLEDPDQDYGEPPEYAGINGDSLNTTDPFQFEEAMVDTVDASFPPEPVNMYKENIRLQDDESSNPVIVDLDNNIPAKIECKLDLRQLDQTGKPHEDAKSLIEFYLAWIKPNPDHRPKEIEFAFNELDGGLRPNTLWIEDEKGYHGIAVDAFLKALVPENGQPDLPNFVEPDFPDKAELLLDIFNSISIGGVQPNFTELVILAPKPDLISFDEIGRVKAAPILKSVVGVTVTTPAIKPIEKPSEQPAPAVSKPRIKASYTMGDKESEVEKPALETPAVEKSAAVEPVPAEKEAEEIVVKAEPEPVATPKEAQPAPAAEHLAEFFTKLDEIIHTEASTQEQRAATVELFKKFKLGLVDERNNGKKPELGKKEPKPIIYCEKEELGVLITPKHLGMLRRALGGDREIWIQARKHEQDRPGNSNGRQKPQRVTA